MEGFQDHLGGDTDAGAALLMLDIASAKSTLEQLRRTYESAAKSHAQTKTELLSLQQQHLNIQGASYALDGLKAPLCSRSAAQQLQALHSENLQLKACLKQEVEARQQLEKKHRELLDLLRNGQVLQLLASGHLTDSAPIEQPHAEVQQLWPSSADIYSRITADAAHCSDQAAPPGTQHVGSDASNRTHAGLQQPGCTASTSSYTSSAADGDSWQPDSTTAVPAGGLAEAQTQAVPAPHSAYFPAQAAMGSNRQQQPMPSHEVPQQPQHGSMLAGSIPGHSSRQHNPVGTPGAKGISAQAAVPTLSSPSAGAPSTWQDSLQHGLFAKIAQQGRTGFHSWTGQQQQQQDASMGPSGLQQQGVGSAAEHQYRQQQQQETFLHAANSQGEQHRVTADISTGFEVDEGLLSTSSSSHSAHSELLDSDDLDELAGLCDSLLHRHETQPLGDTAAALQDAYSTLQHERQRMHHDLAGTTWDEIPGRHAGQHHSEQQQQQQQQHRHASLPGTPQGMASHVSVPGLQALTAQLRQLQEQVSATAMDAAPARGSSSSAGNLRDTRSSSTPGQQPQGWDGSSVKSAHAAVDQHGHGHGSQQSSAQQHSSRAGQRRGSTGSSSSGLWPPGHAQHELDEGPAMASLQQQLAQRMQEVKDRLSNICNGVLQDSAPPAVPDPGIAGPPSSSGVLHGHSEVPASSGFWSPPVSPPARQPRSASKASSAGGARAAAAAAGPSTGSGGRVGRTAARTSAAGKLSPPSFHKSGTAGTTHSYYSNFATRAATVKAVLVKSGPGSTGTREQQHSEPVDAAAAAAFAAIKASIDSTASVPGFFGGSSTPPPAFNTGRSRVGGQPAPSSATAAPAAAAQTAAAECAAGVASAEAPAAACQGSWASASDAAATEDSEGSWATVDESEQEHLQQQLHQQGLHDSQQAANERHVQHAHPAVRVHVGYGRPHAGHSSSLGIGDRTGAQAGPHTVPGWHMPRGDQENCVPRSGACAGGVSRHSPPKTAQDSDQPASPISCESSRLSAAARMPAEVVFSPMKAN